MIELYSEIPDDQKRMVQIIIDNAIAANKPIPVVLDEIVEYRNLCDPNLQDFIDFYLHMKLESIKNESNNDQW